MTCDELQARRREVRDQLIEARDPLWEQRMYVFALRDAYREETDPERKAAILEKLKVEKAELVILGTEFRMLGEEYRSITIQMKMQGC